MVRVLQSLLWCVQLPDKEHSGKFASTSVTLKLVQWPDRSGVKTAYYGSENRCQNKKKRIKNQKNCEKEYAVISRPLIFSAHAALICASPTPRPTQVLFFPRGCLTPNSCCCQFTHWSETKVWTQSVFENNWWPFISVIKLFFLAIKTSTEPSLRRLLKDLSYNYIEHAFQKTNTCAGSFSKK